jgi:hypothetical protein
MLELRGLIARSEEGIAAVGGEEVLLRYYANSIGHLLAENGAGGPPGNSDRLPQSSLQPV